MFFVDWTTGQKFTKVVRASSVVHVAERAFGSEVKWSAPTSPRILEAVLIEMVMNLSAQYFPLFLESRMCFRIDRVLEREKFQLLVFLYWQLKSCQVLGCVFGPWRANVSEPNCKILSVQYSLPAVNQMHFISLLNDQSYLPHVE